MPFSVSFIIAAFVLYSLAIWSDQLKHVLRPWMLGSFIAGFAFDLIGTTIMSCQRPYAYKSIHGITGYIALLVMGLHLIWAIFALKQGGLSLKLFSQCSVYAWTFWTLVLITGSVLM